MDETTRQNAALVEPAADAAAAIQRQAQDLARVISVSSWIRAAPAKMEPVSTVTPSPALRKQIAASPKAKRAVRQEPELTAPEDC